MLTLSLLFALHALYALTAGAGAVALEFRALKGARHLLLDHFLYGAVLGGSSRLG